LASAGVDVAQGQDSDTFVVAVLPFSSSDDEASEELQEEMIEGLDQLGPYTLIEDGVIDEALQGAGIELGQEIAEDVSRSGVPSARSSPAAP
jgi:hypothetical protein